MKVDEREHPSRGKPWHPDEAHMIHKQPPTDPLRRFYFISRDITHLTTKSMVVLKVTSRAHY